MMGLTKLRVAIGLIGLIGALYGLWQAHDYLADARVTKALERAENARTDDTREQVKDEEREQRQQRHDARVSQEAEKQIRSTGYSDCPSVPADYLRMLNRIGEPPPSAAEFIAEVPGTPETAREGHERR